MRHDSEPGNRPGPSLYREFTAELFRLACAGTRLDSRALTARLREELGRASLSRQTLAAWRSGAQAVPAEALLAAMRIANTTTVQLSTQAVVANPAFRKTLPADLDVDVLVPQLIALATLTRSSRG